LFVAKSFLVAIYAGFRVVFIQDHISIKSYPSIVSNKVKSKEKEKGEKYKRKERKLHQSLLSSSS